MPRPHYRSVRAASPVGKTEKLAVDSASDAWLVSTSEGSPMDVEELIGRLCVTAGMIMEDASVGAISVRQSKGERVAALLLASDTIARLGNPQKL